MSNVTIIPSFNLPAEMMQHFAHLGADDLDQGVSAGFPHISIRGAKWRVVAEGVEHPVYLPNTKDLAPFIKVIILRANPNVSKTFYEGQYVEGSDDKPSCYSNDGIRPGADSPSPQSDACATCPQNVWGSKISPSGAKIKACADVRRVAVVPADDMDFTPLMLRVPAASLSDLAAYGRALKQRGIPYAAVVTKLSFDAEAAYPKIQFQYDRVLSAEEMALVSERMNDASIGDILGLNPPRGDAPALAAPAAGGFGIPDNIEVPTAAQAEAAPEPTPEPEVSPEPEVAPEAPATPAPVAAKKTAAKKAAAKTAAPAPQAEAPASATSSMMDDINAALEGLQM